MKVGVRIEFTVEADNEDACHDRVADLTYDMRFERDVSGYLEEIIDVDG